jgi:sulfopyruvate decarboxylase beta subunit
VRPEEGVLTSRGRAIGAVLGLLTDELVVVCNGFPSREAYTQRDRPENFYMIGSMGLAPAIGLGVALAQPRRKVVVLDGDGNVLMALGTLATVGALKPKNFVHIVFDNEAYGSTGNQPTISRTVRLEQVAKAAGYKNVERVRELDDTVYEAKTMLKEDGPSFLLVKVSELTDDVGRVEIEPAAMTERFRKAAMGGATS